MDPEVQPQPAGDPTPEPEQRKPWWQRDDWAQIGTVAAVLVGAGTLLLTAIATYYQARVSSDQLEQSHEVAVQDAREQALLVSQWSGNGDSSFHVMNRSLDPVQDVSVAFQVQIAEDRHHQPPSGLVVFNVKLRSLSPCSEIVFASDVRDLHWKPESQTTTGMPATFPEAWINDGTWREVTSMRGASFRGMRYTDRNGTKWARERDGQLAVAPDYPLGPWTGYKEPAPGRLSRTPPVKPLKTCGGSE